MTDFHSEHTIKKTRKAHPCYQCGQTIVVGSPAHYCCGSYFGDFYTSYTHPECEAAAKAYAKINNLWGDEYPCFVEGDTDTSDVSWMIAHHPVVAERLGWEMDAE